MREYRAKTTKKENREHAFNNVWLEGDLVVSRDKYYIHPRANAFQVDNELAKLVIMHEVIPETVGQCLGKTDKNDKNIFEGDILRGFSYPFQNDEGKFNYYAEVVRFDNCCSFGLVTHKNPKSLVNGISDGDTYLIEDFESEDWEIIGNKWDNPELLKGSL